MFEVYDSLDDKRGPHRRILRGFPVFERDLARKQLVIMFSFHPLTARTYGDE